MTGSSGPFDLAALLAPVRAEDFFRDYWERKPSRVSRLRRQLLADNQ